LWSTLHKFFMGSSNVELRATEIVGVFKNSYYLQLLGGIFLFGQVLCSML
jgi:hypothetical protein